MIKDNNGKMLKMFVKWIFQENALYEIFFLNLLTILILVFCGIPDALFWWQIRIS